eukprot:1518066-Pleurochrysis_carterae.AAC.1
MRYARPLPNAHLQLVIRHVLAKLLCDPTQILQTDGTCSTHAQLDVVQADLLTRARQVEHAMLMGILPVSSSSNKRKALMASSFGSRVRIFVAITDWNVSNEMVPDPSCKAWRGTVVKACASTSAYAICMKALQLQ